MLASRTLAASTINRRRAGEAPLHSAISASVRPQPMQMFAASSEHIRVQGDGGAAIIT